MVARYGCSGGTLCKTIKHMCRVSEWSQTDAYAPMGISKACMAKVVHGLCRTIPRSFISDNSWCLHQIARGDTYAFSIIICNKKGPDVNLCHAWPPRKDCDRTQFISEEFSEFLKPYGINHTRSAPYHPSTNGEAERFVQIFKHNMKCRQATPSNIICHIRKFLLSYRATEHDATGQTLSLMLMSRRITTKFDLISPDFQAQQNHRRWKQLEKHHKVPF